VAAARWHSLTARYEKTRIPGHFERALVSAFWSLLGDVASGAHLAQLSLAAEIPFQTAIWQKHHLPNSRVQRSCSPLDRRRSGSRYTYKSRGPLVMVVCPTSIKYSSGSRM